MSLINEALKRARQESRRREALAKGLPLAPPPPRSVSHRSWLVAAVVAMALALLVSLVTIARLATEDHPSSTGAGTAVLDPLEGLSRSAESAPNPSPARPIEESEATASLPDSPGSAAEIVAPVAGSKTPPPGSANRQPDSKQESNPPAESLDSRPVPLPVENGPVAPSPSPTEVAPPPMQGVSLAAEPRGTRPESSVGDSSSQPRVFIETAILANGDELALGGIAWSETGPYALLDERVVGLGETIHGYMVTRIAPQEVELEGSDGAILIRLE